MAAILAGLVMLYRVANPVRQTERAKEKAVPFQAFPLGAAVPIEADFTDPVFDRFTDLEKRQQLRDWALLAVVENAGLEQPEVRKVLFNMPPVRLDYLDGITTAEYGSTRAKVLPTKEVVALVPREPEQRMKDRIGAIADQAHKETGERPAKIHVFQYTLHPEATEVVVERVQPVESKPAFSEEYGYHRAAIRSASDFEKLMKSIDSLSSVEVEGGVIYLGGRRSKGMGYRGIRVEEVAALWQAEKKLEHARGEMEAFDARWRGRTYRFEFEKARLEKEREEEYQELLKKLGKDAGSRGRASHTGFSLDPTYDYGKLKSLFTLITIQFNYLKEREDEIGLALDARNEAPLLEVLYGLSKSEEPDKVGFARAMERALEKVQFQHARYDGDLRGTEAGMILFYTDLLAKLWALDYMRNAPGGVVADFQPLIDTLTPSIYRRESDERSNTRLWFGALDDGFQRTDNGILFAKNTTRVYAAGSNPLQPGKEAEPNFGSGRFLGWWNNNYETIAQYEPEYERLNELMKWSLALATLQQKEAFEKLGFLERVAVNRTHWFSDWVKERDLRFRRWDSIGFHERGHLGVETEALPLLQSRSNAQGYVLSGGVSLGSKNLLAERPLVQRSLDQSLRRSNYRFEVENGSQALHRLDKTKFVLGEDVNGRASTVQVTPRQEAKLRGARMEVANRDLSVALQARSDGMRIGLEFREGKAALGVGEVSIDRTTKGFRAAFRSTAIEQRQSVAADLASAERRGLSIEEVLATHRAVEQAILSKGEVALKFKGSNEWTVMSPEGAAAVDLKQGADTRIAAVVDLGGGKADGRVTFSTFSDSAMRSRLGNGSYLAEIDSKVTTPGAGVYRVYGSRPPPRVGKAIRIGELGEKDSLSSSLDGRFGRQREFSGGELASQRNLRQILMTQERLAAYQAECRNAVKEIDTVLAKPTVTASEISRLEPLFHRYASDPAVRARGAIARLRTGRSSEAARDLMMIAKPGNGSRLQTFAEEAYRGLPKTEKNVHNLNTIREYVRGRRAGSEEYRLFGDEAGVLGVELRITKLGAAKQGDGTQLAGFVYDAPVRAENPVPTAGEAVYREVPNWNPKLPLPDRIWVVETNQLVSTKALTRPQAKAATQEVVSGGRPPTTPTWRANSPPPCPGNDEQGKEPAGNCDEKTKIYVRDGPPKPAGV